MTTITNNKLTDERVSNATLIRLIQWAEQHNSHYVAAALCELQERRKADSAEPACYALTNMAGEVYNTHSSAQNAGAYRDLIHQSDDSLTLRVTPLYAAPPVPEKMNFSTACNFVQINGMAKEDRATLAMRAWNACRAAMLNGGKS
ncbi:hypothetical protein EAP68_13200 [Salmonella enterica]|nr:hypothetical protein [Salmonella enterica]